MAPEGRNAAHPLALDGWVTPAERHRSQMIRDVVMTIGWNLDATQRAALEAYRVARLSIRNLLDELLRGEAQRDPYKWSAAMVGHCWVGVGMWGIVAIIMDRRAAVYIAPPSWI